MVTEALCLILLTLGHRVSSWDNGWDGVLKHKFVLGRPISSASRRASSKADIYSGISEINRNVKGLTEGDIRVSKSRNARICKSDQCKWKKSSDVVEVPYTIASSFTREQRNTIIRAMDTFREKTCINFVRRSSQSDYLNIINSDGCWSNVGRKGGLQDLSLHHSAESSCIQSGTIQHELLHALGFWHEQSRNDRDRYVRINWANVKTNNKHNFDKHDTNNLNTEYDYSSVMHYGGKAFSKNGQDTITPIKNPSAVIGQRKGMTDTDILKINRLYTCRSPVWDNNWSNTLFVKCPSGQAVSAVESIHSDEKKDRRWRISCRQFGGPVSCHWSDYANDFGREIQFKCPARHVIAGVYSVYRGYYGDRRWRFYCCKASYTYTSNCQTTNYMNNFDEAFKWDVPGGSFLTGLNSKHSDYYEDRRWGFRYCQTR